MGRTEEATTDWTPLEKQSSPVKVFSPGKSSPVRLRLVPKKVCAVLVISKFWTHA